MADRVPPVHGWINFDYREVAEATNNFDNRPVKSGGCRVSEGGFGDVYKGYLRHTEVAIKVLKNVPKGEETRAQAEELFETELNVQAKFRHPNLVMLIGYSSTPSKPRCLIHEFLSNGTLEEALEIGLGGGATLNTKSGSIHLPWMCRLATACDLARGLAYLHTADHKRPLVHCNVTSANVLLDLSFKAKLCNFGLAKSLQEGEEESRTDRVVGTAGYIAPEYYRGIVTTKMDTFAFGVILLELISGLPAYDPRRNPKDLITYMEKDMDTDIPQILCTKMDEHAGAWPSESFVSLFRIARKCVEPKMHNRPEIHQVYPELRELVTLSAQLYSKQEKFKKTRQ